MTEERGEYVIPTVEVDPAKLEKLDSKSSSREKDGVTIRLPSRSNSCPLQLWEVYVAVAVLILQPHSSVISEHIKALCEHNEPRLLCECVLKEHTSMGTVTETKQATTLYTFLEEYFSRKFQMQFDKNTLKRYVMYVLDDPFCGRNGIARVYLLGPHVQAFLLNAQYWEGQYDELFDAMQMVNLPVNDVLKDGEVEIGDAAELSWDNAKLYEDPHLILRKYGGWAVTKAGKMLTPKDQLVLRLTGCTLAQLLQGESVPDSPRMEGDEVKADKEEQERMTMRAVKSLHRASKKRTKSRFGTKQFNSRLQDSFLFPDFENNDDDSDNSHASDYEIDPEHRKVVPFGVTLCEMYLLLRGLLIGQDTSSAAWKNAVVGQPIALNRSDGHILAAAVLVDLYMREQIDLHHWTLTEGSIAVAYKAEPRRNAGHMDHFLDEYVPHAERIFRDMRLPRHLVERPIWTSLEDRGIIDNSRPSWERVYGILVEPVTVWDLVRPDLILDLKEGYVVAARVLYDKDSVDPLDEESNDALMFCYLLQLLFDDSFEAFDGLPRVLNAVCPPFQKGELFPPVAMVHGGSVCLGLIDRAFRFGNGKDARMASEAAEFNEAVMQRLEDTFFLSPTVWEAMDSDLSGELSMEEFVEGMRKANVYKDFRKERVPEDVLQTIIADLAERLFHEVDINMDGTLTHAELQAAYRRRHDEALQRRRQRHWFRVGLQAIAVQAGLGGAKTQRQEPARVEAQQLQTKERDKALLAQQQRKSEWQSEVERLVLPDEFVDAKNSIIA